jgi:hypothetical protein
MSAVSVKEILDLPVVLLADLTTTGLLVTLGLRLNQNPLLWTTSRTRTHQAIYKRLAVFTPHEYEAAAYAAQEDRARPAEAASWHAHKVTHPGWRLEPEEALAGAWGLLASGGVVGRREQWSIPVGALRWTFAQVLTRLGLELVEVVVEQRPTRGRLGPQASATDTPHETGSTPGVYVRGALREGLWPPTPLST